MTCFVQWRLRHAFCAVVVALATVIGLGMVAPTPSFAQKKQSVVKLIKKGQGFFDEQRYEESIQTLSAALMRPGTDPEERVQVYKLLAYNFIVLQRAEEADGAVRGLLALDEDYQLPETESPRFRDVFDKVRKQWVADGRPGVAKAAEPVVSKVKVRHSPPDQVEPDSVVGLEGTVDDPEAEVAKMRLYYRTGSSGKFKSTTVKYAMRKFSANIPADAVAPPIIEYYFEGLDKSGLPLTSFGDAELPLRSAVSDSTSVLESPWFWIPVGAAVAAIVVVVAVVATSGGSDSTVTVAVFD